MSNDYEQQPDSGGHRYVLDADVDGQTATRSSSGLIRAGIFGIILFLAIVGFTSVLNQWVFKSNDQGASPREMANDATQTPSEPRYKQLERSWVDTRKLLEVEFQNKRNLLAIVAQTEAEITLNEQNVVRAENALTLAESMVLTAQQHLREIESKIADLEKNTPEDAFEDAQLAKLTASEDAKSVQEKYEQAKIAKKRTEITVGQLRRAAKAADAASSASRLVVSAALAAKQAVSDNQDVMLSADDAAMTNLENNFFSGAESQADSVEKSARAAEQAVLIAQTRLDNLENLEKDLQKQFAAANKEEQIANEVLASIEKQITAHLEKMSKAQQQRDISQARLAAAQKKADDEKQALQTQEQAVASLREELKAAKNQAKTAEKTLETVKSSFQSTESALKKLHHERAEKIAVAMADINAKLNDRLRQTISGATPDHPIFDRLVFSSAKLFEPGSAVLGKGGKDILIEIVPVLEEVAAELPEDSGWVLRVDGHTDNQPLSGSGRFRDNWELSQARALSVVRFLVDATSLEPGHLSANGYGEFQPLTDGTTEEDLARNRRIELTLASR